MSRTFKSNTIYQISENWVDYHSVGLDRLYDCCISDESAAGKTKASCLICDIDGNVHPNYANSPILISIEELEEVELCKEEISLKDLRHYTGTENHRKLSDSSRLTYTDGIKAMAEMVQAYWLIQLMESYVSSQPRLLDDFCLWDIQVNPDHTAVVSCREDTDKQPYIQQDIPFTDFPESYEWYVINGTILLKSEY